MLKGLFLSQMKIPDLPYDSLIHRIYNINEKEFEGVAMQVWKYQYAYNPTYRTYCTLLDVAPGDVRGIEDMPFLPISVFKHHVVKTDEWATEAIFRSSGTTGSHQSQHHIRHLEWYHQIALQGFQSHFEHPGQFVWLGLLPAYLDRPDSSLVDMVHAFMSVSGHKENEFFPNVNEELVTRLKALALRNEKVILVGVTFALLDLFEQFDVPVWDNLLVLETGGMKGRGKEITREEVYQRLQIRHNNLRIGSEYGMTELMSQAYRTSDHFIPGIRMKIFIRDISDPLTIIGSHQRGAINVIDLANVDTCAFIATDDIGVAHPNGCFDVLGRLDNSDLRGCNLLYT
jgi:hypothetical protein